MAKKKRGTPSKTCVNPACEKTMHARCSVCPHCRTPQPGKSERVPASEPTAPSPQRSNVEQPVAGLFDAVSFVRQVGGLDQAKSLLQTIEDIKNL